MNKTTALVIAGLSAATAAAPSAATTYLFNFTYPGHVGTGHFITSGPATAAVVGIDGFIDGDAITGLTGYASADNMLLAGFSFFTQSGISFIAGGVSYNLYNFEGPGITNSIDNPQGVFEGLTPLTTLSVTAVPEAATWAMMIAGFGLVGAAMRRRQAAVTA